INGKLLRPRETAAGKAVTAVKTFLPRENREVPAEAKRIIEEMLKQSGAPAIEAPYTKLPPAVQKLRLWAISQLKFYAANDNLNLYLMEEMAQMSIYRQQHPYPLGNRPLIVLSRGQELNAEHQQLQTDLTLLSHNSKQVIVPNSG